MRRVARLLEARSSFVAAAREETAYLGGGLTRFIAHSLTAQIESGTPLDVASHQPGHGVGPLRSAIATIDVVGFRC